MYIIVVYDIEEKRVTRVHKYLKRFLFWRQNSVFEGEITESNLFKLKKDLEKMIKDRDGVIIYVFPNKNNVELIEIGEVRKIENII